MDTHSWNWHDLKRDQDKYLADQWLHQWTTQPNESYPNSEQTRLLEECRILQLTRECITDIPSLPSDLKKLFCAANNLSSLPPLPSTLIELNCNNNQLTCLPELPPNLKKLVCTDNQLTRLPDLPEGLEELYCSRNNIIFDKPFPSTLKILYCGENHLQSIPELPNGIIEVYCYSNCLRILPSIPDTVSQINFSNNPDLIYPQLINNVSQNRNIFHHEMNDIKNHINNINQQLYHCRLIYQSLKYKNKLRKWLWKLRENKAKKDMHPSIIYEMLAKGKNIDEIYEKLIKY